MFRYLTGWIWGSSSNTNTPSTTHPVLQTNSLQTSAHSQPPSQSTSQSTTKIVISTKKAAQWRQGTGGWQKVGSSLADNSSPSPENNNSTTDNTTDNTTINALGHFQAELKAKSELYNILHNKWMAIKIDIIGKGQPAIDHTKKETISGSISEIFKKIWSGIKGLLEPAHQNLNEVLEQTNGLHIKELSQQLDKLCKALDKESLEDDSLANKSVKRQIKIEICDMSIAILNEMIDMISKVSAEIDYCLKTEELGETAAKKLIQILLTILTQIPLPELDFSLKESYKVFLNDEIEENEVDFDVLATNTEGELQNALSRVKEGKRELNEAREDINNNESPSLPKNKSRSLSLFPSTPIPPKKSDHTPELPKRSMSPVHK